MASTTVWTLCREVSADELTELRALAWSKNRTELRRRIRATTCGAALKLGDCLRLENELLSMAAEPAPHGGSSTPIARDPQREEIIQQLRCIVGLCGKEAKPVQPRSWRVEVGPSSAQGGGDGVFVRGRCEMGTVLAVYPGVAYATRDLALMAKLVLEGNHYTLFLKNGVVLDGRPDGPSRIVFESAVARDLVSGISQSPLIEHAELCTGHKVNHPPRGTRPNVRVFPLDLGRDEDVELHPYLPVVNARPPSDSTPWKRTAVLVASRAVCDEELWLDYKLRHQVHKLPEWYEPCDPTRDPTRDGDAYEERVSSGSGTVSYAEEPEGEISSGSVQARYSY